MDIEPILKYPGGKRKLYPWIEEHMPHVDCDVYVEPFIGAGSVLLSKQPKGTIWINDLNPHLFDLYSFLLSHTDSELQILLDELDRMFDTLLSMVDPVDQSLYYSETRKAFNMRSGLSDIQMLAHLIFLNRTCFNGLFRVNSKGEFNVPFGQYKNFNLVSLEEKILANSEYFRSIEDRTVVTCLPYDTHLRRVYNETEKNKRIFIYCDPPYVPTDDTKQAFTEYTKEKFSLQDNLDVLRFLRHETPVNVMFLFSNINRKELLDVAKEYHWSIHEKDYAFIIAKASNKQVKEVLISNYR